MNCSLSNLLHYENQFTLHITLAYAGGWLHYRELFDKLNTYNVLQKDPLSWC